MTMISSQYAFFDISEQRSINKALIAIQDEWIHRQHQLNINNCSLLHTVELGNPHSGLFSQIGPSAQRGLPFARERN